MSKPLDLADKYDSSLQEDEYAPDSEPTVKVHMPNFLPKVIVQEGDNVPDFDDEITVVDHDVHETRYPGIGLALVLVTGGIFWGVVLWAIFGR